MWGRRSSERAAAEQQAVRNDILHVVSRLHPNVYLPPATPPSLRDDNVDSFAALIHMAHQNSEMFIYAPGASSSLFDLFVSTSPSMSLRTRLNSAAVLIHLIERSSWSSSSFCDVLLSSDNENEFLWLFKNVRDSSTNNQNKVNNNPNNPNNYSHRSVKIIVSGLVTVINHCKDDVVTSAAVRILGSLSTNYLSMMISGGALEAIKTIATSYRLHGTDVTFDGERKEVSASTPSIDPIFGIYWLPSLRLLSGVRTEIQRTARLLTLPSLNSTVGAHGIRILCLDGGGTRGVMSIEILDRLCEIVGVNSISDCFDLVCGTSTGGILALALAHCHKPLHEVRSMYHSMCSKVFAAQPVVSMGKLLLTRSYYDAEILSNIMKREIGIRNLIDPSNLEDEDLLDIITSSEHPKRRVNVFVVSSTNSSDNIPTPFLFRNYRLSPMSPSRYDGDCSHQIWEAVRATTAAPTYFAHFTLRGRIHQDGATLANNPSGIAIHEASKLWPGIPIACVISVGTGGSVTSVLGETVNSNSNSGQNQASNFGWSDIARSILFSATNTEATYHLLSDLLPMGKYLRLNPSIPTGIANIIDESRPEILERLAQSAREYASSPTVVQDFKKVLSYMEPCDTTLVRGTLRVLLGTQLLWPWQIKKIQHNGSKRQSLPSKL